MAQTEEIATGNMRLANAVGWSLPPMPLFMAMCSWRRHHQDFDAIFHKNGGRRPGSTLWIRGFRAADYAEINRLLHPTPVFGQSKP